MRKLTREMAKELLESNGDRKLIIPEGIQELEEDFALFFDEPNYKYHFEEIRIPSTVRIIPPLFLSEGVLSSDEAWMDSFECISVDEGNEDYCSIDGVLFSKDRKKLLCFPTGKKEKTYIVPDGTISIEIGAFRNNRFLRRVVLPQGVESIETQAFMECECLEEVVLPDSLKTIEEEAFIFTDIPRFKSQIVLRC